MAIVGECYLRGRDAEPVRARRAHMMFMEMSGTDLDLWVTRSPPGDSLGAMARAELERRRALEE